MNQFLNFLTKLKSFWKLYKDYGYDGEAIEFIIDTYEKLLCERTKTMSKPTCYLKDILAEIDRWYEERDKVRIYETYDYQRQRIDFSVDFWDIESKDGLVDAVIKKMTEKIEEGNFLE